jgi:hypothetical protein
MDPQKQESRPSRGGRPSKGDRVGLTVRVPRELAVLFSRDAARAGMSQSDRMAEILTSLYASSVRGLLFVTVTAHRGVAMTSSSQDQRPRVYASSRFSTAASRVPAGRARSAEASRMQRTSARTASVFAVWTIATPRSWFISTASWCPEGSSSSGLRFSSDTCASTSHVTRGTLHGRLYARAL